MRVHGGHIGGAKQQNDFQIKERSSQLLRNLSSCEKKALKKNFLFLLNDIPLGNKLYSYANISQHERH